MSDSEMPGNGWENGAGVTDGSDSHLDRLFECLSHHHRRLILSQLQEERSIPETAILEQFPEPNERARIHLHHRHLPKLVKTGYVNWDQQTNEVSRGPCFKQIARFLEPLSTIADEWP